MSADCNNFVYVGARGLLGVGQEFQIGLVSHPFLCQCLVALLAKERGI